MRLKVGYFVLCLVLSSLFQGSVEAKPLKIALGLSIPPYVIKEEGRGIEFDILKEVLASQGYEMEPVYVPLARTLRAFEMGGVDGVMSTGIADLPGCYTDPHITYWNFAISLSDRAFEINSIDDLKDKSIMSFQNAKNYLGDDFHQMAIANKKYKEIADQSIQNKLLFQRRIDVVVADRYIFEWYRNDPEVSAIVNVNQKVTYHPLFEPSHFSAVFQSIEVCKAFNLGLKAIKESGRYDEIISSYNVRDSDFAN